ncbi:MAG: hypothetical protein ACJ74L_01675 [Gaiellaceae bacterium]
MATAERELRAAQNQLLFRSVNDRIKELGEKALNPIAELDFACECDKPDCHEPITLAIEEFAAVERAGKNRFIVLAGHEDDDVEDVIARNERYFIVAKRGAGAEFIRQNA